MHIVEEKNVGLAWISYLNIVLLEGHLYHDEEEQILECEDIVLSIKDDIQDDAILNTLADSNIKALYLKKMQTEEIVPELNASYGQRIYNQLGINQYQWCVDRLRRKPETKAATMVLLLPNDPGPRIPCLDIVDFKLRDGVLDTKVFFRSQNAMNAYGNLCGIFWLSGEMAKDLGVKRGMLTCFISNAHLYTNMIDQAKSIVEKGRSIDRNHNVGK